MLRTITALLALSALCFGSIIQLPAGARGAEGDSVDGQRVFGTSKLNRLHLSMDEKQFAALTPAGFGPTPAGFGTTRQLPRIQSPDVHRNTFGVAFPWSKCSLEFDGETYNDVGLRYKGNYTYMATARALKKSFKIDINRHVESQKLDGLTMLNLNCNVSDASRTREAFAFAFFRDVGVPAPRTSFVELTLTVPMKYDQEYVGVYTLVEQVNKGFLKRHFKDGKGMLLKPEGLQGGPAYLGDEWQPYANRYKPDEPPTDEQKKRLIAFTKLISQGSDEEFAAQIGEFLDVEAFLRFIAANALLSNLDSYLGFGHNYYLYLVPDSNQFVFIPWDLDLSLATWPAVGTPEQLVDLSIRHPHAGEDKLLDRLLAIPAHQERYMKFIQELFETNFNKDRLLSTLSEIENTLKEPMALETKAVAARRENRSGGAGAGGTGPGGAGPGGRGGFGNGQFGASLPPRKFIDRRIASVTAQLTGKSKGFEPRPFNAGGPGRPAGGGGAIPGVGPVPGLPPKKDG